MIKFVQGDIFENSVDIRVNTVNCVGAMGAGVALAFKKRYPEMFKEYQAACKHGLIKPGVMHVWKTLDGAWIVNFPTKRDWRDPSRYEDIEIGLDDFRQYLDSVGPVSVALPALGCGNGGLDWERVSKLILDKLEGVNAQVYVYEPSASRRAGMDADYATDNERKLAEELGYGFLGADILPSWKLSKSFYIKGAAEVGQDKWLAVFPSSSPEARELNALRSIAKELSRWKSLVSIALMHATKGSEEVASIFASFGVRTVLLLPFGVLSKKVLSGKELPVSASSVVQISMAAPSAKWSRSLVAQCVDILKINSAAVLISDPNPDWLVGKSGRGLELKPVSYVRYEISSLSSMDALRSIKARPIARRSETGEPNLDFLLKSLKVSDAKFSPGLSGSYATDTEGAEENLDVEEYRIKFAGLSVERKQHVLSELSKLSVSEVVVKLSSDASDSERNRLVGMGFKVEG